MAGAMLTAGELAAFRDQALTVHEDAVRRRGQSVVSCVLAGGPFSFAYAGTALREAFQPALVGILDAPDGPPLGRILICDSSESGVQHPLRDLLVPNSATPVQECIADDAAFAEAVRGTPHARFPPDALPAAKAG